MTGRAVDDSTFFSPTRKAVGTAAACALLLVGCSAPRNGAARSTTTAAGATTTTVSATTAVTGSPAPTPLPATYTDAPVGAPGYALVVNPGPTGSGAMGGIAVYQYQDGKEVGFFSFYGKSTSPAPFTMNIKGDPAATTAVSRVIATPTSSITIENCARLFSPSVPNGANGEAEPPAPGSCTFTYKLAPGPPRTTPTVTTNLTATPADKSGLLDAYLFQNGWQTQYTSDITLRPGTTYLAYDPQTGLNWGLAQFAYSGPASGAAGAPDVAMQDGGDIGFFYQIPIPGQLPSGDDGWVMVGIGGEPNCLARSIFPSTVVGLWGLTDSPACSTQG